MDPDGFGFLVVLWSIRGWVCRSGSVEEKVAFAFTLRYTVSQWRRFRQQLESQ